MKPRTAIAIVLAAALISGAAVQARAGDREWARAGRILTGYVVLRTLLGEPLLTYGRHRPMGWSGHYPSVFDPYDSRSHTRYGAYRTYAPRTRVRRVPPGDPPQRWDSRPAEPAFRPGEDTGEPMIVPLPDGRRLYQPATAGSPAYVQVWSAEEKRWNSVARMPSLR